MESVLLNCYQPLVPYKDEIIRKLNLISDKILQAITKQTHTQISNSQTEDWKKFVIINQAVLNFMSILHTCNTLCGLVNLINNNTVTNKNEDHRTERDETSHKSKKQDLPSPLLSPLTLQPPRQIDKISKSTELSNKEAPIRSLLVDEKHKPETPPPSKSAYKNPTPPKPENREKRIPSAIPGPDTFHFENSTPNRKKPHCDWRAKVVDSLKNPKLKITLTWSAPVQTKCPPRDTTQRKPKPKYEIADDDLSVGQKCTVCHIESPSEFYIQTDQNLLENFEEYLNNVLNKQYQYVGNNFATKIEAREQVGNFCLGYLLQRRKWYRLEVIDWMEHDDDTVLIQLVDYGEKFFHSYTNLKRISDGFYVEFPKMAIRCHLAGINWFEPWSTNTVNCFVELTQQREFIVIYTHRERDSWAVDLRTTEDANADSLGELLSKEGHAFPEEIPPDENVLFSPEDCDSDVEEYNINEAVAGYDAKDEARICPFSKRGGCFKGARCRFEHGRLSEDGITTDKVLTINRAQAELILPSAGDVVELLVTGYISTCHFYAQLLSTQNKNLSNLMETMKSSTNIQTYESFKIFPGIGEIVLVRDNSQWYRGRCVGYCGSTDFEIFLVDFGYVVTKGLKDLRVMKEEFTYLPFQAVECVIANCRERKSASQPLWQLYFNSALSMKTFNAFVVQTGNEFIRVHLWDSNGKDVGHTLKELGLVEDTNEEFYPVEDICEF